MVQIKRSHGHMQTNITQQAHWTTPYWRNFLLLSLRINIEHWCDLRATGTINVRRAAMLVLNALSLTRRRTPTWSYSVLMARKEHVLVQRARQWKQLRTVLRNFSQFAPIGWDRDTHWFDVVALVQLTDLEFVSHVIDVALCCRRPACCCVAR